MNWETVIGLETHVELSTESKLFCSCSTAFGGAPNAQCCPVCTGLPGALPVLNEKAVELAVMAGMALEGTVNRHCGFDRKHYFYPDLPKGYQITQRRTPIVQGGQVLLRTPSGVEKVIRIHELHLEEDAGKLSHDPQSGYSRCDYNRCGVPLIEIVTCPDFFSAEEVIAYLEKLCSILQYLGVSDCKLQEGSLRCDVNLSVRPAGSIVHGVRTELKNLGSFKAITRAIAYESLRQIDLLSRGGTVIQETRRWDEALEISIPMRAKESIGNYRYSPEPNLPPLLLSEAYLRHIRAQIPELAEEKLLRYQRDWGLPLYDCQMLTSQRAIAAFFEETVALGASPKQAANWIMGELFRQLSITGLSVSTMSFTPASLARLIHLVSVGRLNRNTAVKVFEAVFLDNSDVDRYISEHGLEQISDIALLEETIIRVLSTAPKSVADYAAGKEKAFGHLVGQVMNALKGQAPPQLVAQLLRTHLKKI